MFPTAIGEWLGQPIRVGQEARPVDPLEYLTNEQIINRLINLSWGKSSNGLPQVELKSLSDDDRLFLENCDRHYLVHKRYQNTHGKPLAMEHIGYYVCSPRVLQGIPERGDDLADPAKQRIRQDFIELLPKLAALLPQEIRPDGSVTVSPETYEGMEKLMQNFSNAEHSFVIHGIHYGVSADPDHNVTGYGLRLADSKLGTAMLGEHYLNSRSQTPGIDSPCT